MTVVKKLRHRSNMKSTPKYQNSSSKEIKSQTFKVSPIFQWKFKNFEFNWIMLLFIALQIYFVITRSSNYEFSGIMSVVDTSLVVVTFVLIALLTKMNIFLFIIGYIIWLVFIEFIRQRSQLDLNILEQFICSSRSASGGHIYGKCREDLPYISLRGPGEYIVTRAFPANGTMLLKKTTFIPAKYPKEWITDKDVLDKLKDRDIYVHRGFLDEYKRYKEILKDFTYSRLSILYNFKKSVPRHSHIYIGGHSGTGVLGAFEAFELLTNSNNWGIDRSKIHLITTGAPAFGDDLFNSILDSLIASNTRVITPLDPIPKMLETKFKHSGRVMILPLTLDIKNVKDLSYHTGGSYKRAFYKKKNKSS